MARLTLDLHTHLKVARRVAFRPQDMPLYARALRSRGLDGLAIAEHAHGADFWGMYESLLERYTYRLGRFEVDGALFYPGFELTLAEHVDVLVLGPLASLRQLDDAFPIAVTGGYHPDGAEFAEAALAVAPDTLRIAAHPARDDKNIEQLCLAVRQSVFHAAEINACHASDLQVVAVRERAARKGWSITGGSDAHAWPQLGAAYTLLDVCDDSFEGVRQAIVAGACSPVVHPQRDRLVRVGKRLKAHIKKRSAKIAKLPWRSSEGVLVAGSPAEADRLFEPAFLC